MAGFVLKVMVLSTVLSIAIKQGGPLLPVAATTPNALIAVWLPSGVLALILGWRLLQNAPAKE